MNRLMEKPRLVSQDHYLLRIGFCPGRSLPGQFITVRISNRHDPLLRRPFSIFNHEGGIIEIIVKTVGTGTELLVRRDPGEIDVIGPLGTGFTLPQGGRVLVAGGGVGNAPLYHLARRLAESRCDVTYLYGARTRSFIYLADRFRDIADRFILATDDGSEGREGLVTDIAAELIEAESFDMIYACGPTAMMRTIVRLANGTPVQVSVETYFGCGTGLCSGCSVETAGVLKRACIDGPVFFGAPLNWDSVPD
ncbi:MAG: hypothetical protein A2176_09800 [Spirochaetes bacterium RBG_13_51_14]|nr:MAG: hypothetical protein A2176_09800 [Spirochaetes bacterium RBG_13_51_14]